MIVSLIVAADNKLGIGKNNQLLWHLPNDLKFFKNTTWAMPVAIGRKTFESLGNKLLPGRQNIIITHQNNYHVNGAVIVNSITAAIEWAKKNFYKEIFIAGGGEIYKQALPLAHKIYLTKVNATLEADTFFPAIPQDWHLVKEDARQADEKHTFDYTFQIWEK
jgi:dihydrofolate reductase